MLLSVTMLLCSAVASAYDFQVDSICYNVTSETDLTVEVTSGEKYSGEIIIPSTVTYNEKKYMVTSIGEEAFNLWRGLTNVTISNGVVSIGNRAFLNCFDLTSITIPNSVRSIGECAFYNCINLKSITISNSVTSIGDHAFYNCTRLTSIIIPESVTSIGEGAFNKCYGITSITIPNSVTSISNSTFYDCIGLTSITIPNSVTSIGNYAFYGCKGLTSITIPNSVTSIGSATFMSCGNLKSITIGDNVTNIGIYSFFYCTNLTEIYLKGVTPAIINHDSFSKYIATLYVPQGSLEAYKAADGWKGFKNIVEFDPTGIEDVAEEDAPAFEITDGGIKLTAAEGKTVAVYTTAGALVEKIDSYAGEEITLDKGVYIICVGDKAVKVRL